MIIICQEKAESEFILFIYNYQPIIICKRNIDETLRCRSVDIKIHSTTIKLIKSCNWVQLTKNFVYGNQTWNFIVCISCFGRSITIILHFIIKNYWQFYEIYFGTCMIYTHGTVLANIYLDCHGFSLWFQLKTLHPCRHHLHI